MKRSILVALVLIAFTGGVAAARFAPIEMPFRHQVSDSLPVFQGEKDVDGVKIVYIRDGQAPATCTQVVIIETEYHVVAAHPDSCVF